MHTPIPLVPEQIPQATTILAQAFQDYPVFVAAVPQAEVRAALIPPLFQRTVRYSLRFGRVETTAALEGVACWLRPGEAHFSLWRQFRFGFLTMAARFGWAAYRRFRQGQDVTDRLHAQHAPMPHWYLWALGVDPQRQGTGVGGVLLNSMFAQLRTSEMPCYLETHHEANVSYYQRHGFRVVAAQEIPATGLHIWAMLRPPERG